MRYCANGYLVTEGPTTISGINYCGVDSNAWPIGLTPLEKWVPIICEEALNDLSFPLLLDLGDALRYYAICKNVGKTPHLLYCEVLGDYSEGTIGENRNSPPYVFLGFDYAYPSGDYYSAVANDIIYHKGYFMTKWRHKLNQYGLFSRADQIQAFVKDRKNWLNRSVHNHVVELGNFVVFRIFEVDYREAMFYVSNNIRNCDHG